VRNVLGLLYPVSTVVAEKEKRRKAIPSLKNIVALYNIKSQDGNYLMIA